MTLARRFHRERTKLLIACLVGITATTSRGADSPVDADLLLKGGILHVGDGMPPNVGSVAVTEDRIVAVGDFPVGRVARVLDCRGLVICPGFIDVHNHSDEAILLPETRAAMNYITQGCTTIVTGNCGMGPIHVEAFYQQLERHGVGPNVAHLLPHGNLRREVVGMEQQPATDEQLEQMCGLTAKAMREGAWGISTGLIYVPSSYADTDELVKIASVIGDHGGIYVSHIRNENVGLLAAIDEVLEIGRRADLPVHVSHFKSTGKDSWGLVRVAVDVIEKARATGQRVTADQYPYTASSTSLQAILLPTWARAGGRDATLARLDDLIDRDRIFDEVDRTLESLDDGQRLQIAYFAAEPTWGGQRLSDVANQLKVSPRDLAIRIIREGGASVVNHSINELDVRFVMQRPWVATASDGSAKLPGATVPHPRNYGTFPRKIGHYAVRESVVSLAQAIRGATGLPADIMGMTERGYLRDGMAADIVVFDPQVFLDRATFQRPHQYATGIQLVFVNGKPVVSGGVPTGALAGRALRKTERNSNE